MVILDYILVRENIEKSRKYLFGRCLNAPFIFWVQMDNGLLCKKDRFRDGGIFRETYVSKIFESNSGFLLGPICYQSDVFLGATCR